MKKVFISADLPGNSIQQLKKDFEVEIFPEDRSPTYDELLRGSKDAYALITMVSDRVDKAVLDSSPNLKIVSNCGVGYENIDVAYATQKGIYITNTPGVLTQATADLAWALIMSVGRRIVEGDAFMRDRNFIGWRPKLLLGMNIHGKTLGIYGMGRIGAVVAKRGKGFDLRIIYHNRRRHEEAEKETGAAYVDFPTLLRESDFIVITSPLNAESRGRFGIEEFNQMKKTSILVNVGRGQIVKEKELITALKNGIIWGAGLDVYENEPVVEEELFKLNNAVLLPHLGSSALETRERMADMAIGSVVSTLNGQVPANLVNRESLKLK